jgi:SAM-dependent methyltransferase
MSTYNKAMKDFLNRTLMKLNFKLTRIPTPVKRSGLNINVGCGSYEIDGFISVDFYSEHYYQSSKFNRVHYDMRKDALPFKNDSVDVIYCSHVIEHIETRFVERFFSEAHRILKVDGVLRIACPDALFLYQQMREFPSYFAWHPMYQQPTDAIKCFVDEVATHRSDVKNFGLDNMIKYYSYDELMENLRSDGEFDESTPGRHINNWDYKRIKGVGHGAGFITIFESKNKGSVSPSLQGYDIDLTHPQMSLYVDLVKREPVFQ